MAKEFTKFVNDEVFKHLQSDVWAFKYPNREQKVVLTDSRGLHGGAHLYRKKNYDKLFADTISGSVEHVYSVDFADAKKMALMVANKVKINKFREISESNGKMTVMGANRLNVAFTDTEYLGDANIKFEKYLWTCWSLYYQQRKVHKAPYLAVVQSSGFGKSRMLYELARQAPRTPPSSKQMKVLYVCARLRESRGFPEATNELCQWLFPSRSTCSIYSMTKRLQAIYRHAHEYGANIQDEWTDLFTEFSADKSVKNTLEKSEKALKVEYNDTKDETAPLVILVIDEARSLFDLEHNGVDYSRVFRQALVAANSKIKTGGGIFGVLVDTKCMISDLVPGESNVLTSFPPFVFTHTMDVIWRSAIETNPGMDTFDNEEVDEKMVYVPDKTMVDTEMSETETKVENLVATDNPVHKRNDCSAEIAAYKATLTGSEREAWKALMRMGRPMWERTFSGQPEHEVGEKDISEVVVFAANQLLLGFNHRDQTSYNEATMFGVASVLCRLGMRPYSRSSLASRVIADFMAILAYVDYEKEGYLSSYASDPVLTLGAMKMWYGKGDRLSKYILPQLKKLILNETLDTGGVGEMVVRIVLLLAMDSCVIAGKPIDDCEFSGQFVPLEALLKVLGVDEMPLKNEGMAEPDLETYAAFEDWYSQWMDW